MNTDSTRPDRLHAADERLESWKEIAAYLRRAERTVRRWEETEGLPVHRHHHERRGSVYAIPAELDRWLLSRRVTGPQLEPVAASPPEERKPERKWMARPVVLLALATVLLAGALTPLLRKRPPSVAAVRVKPLTSTPGSEVYPSLSPDGRQVAFSWTGPSDSSAEFDIYVQSPGANSPRRLNAPVGVNLGPAWSPDGSRIAWLQFSSGRHAALKVAPAAGGAEQDLGPALTPNWNFWSNLLGWSPDHEWLVLADEAVESAPASIYAVSVRTRERRRLTEPSQYPGDESPAISPDGRYLAFCRRDGIYSGDVYLVPLGPGLAPLGPPKQMSRFRAPTAGLAWQSDSKSLLLSAGPEGAYRLFRIAVSGNPAPSMVTEVAGSPILPTIAAAGSRLAFADQSQEVQLWAFRKDSPDWVPLIRSTRHDGYPRYSPDGSTIAFMSSRTGTFELWLANSDGANARQLTQLGRRTGYAAWSPDGRQLTFASNSTGHFQIYTISADGGEPRQLTSDNSESLFPAWSRSGKWIFFSSNRAGAHQIFRIAADGSAGIRQITREGGLAVRPLPDGRNLVYARDTLYATDLRTVPIDGGQEKQLASALFGFVNFEAADDGILWVPFRGRGHALTVELLPFHGGASRVLHTVPDQFRLFGLSATADRKWLAVGRLWYQRLDLMQADKY